jgi:hypothetical protein
MLALITNDAAWFSSVYPSGFAFATVSAPRMPFAPGRLSITIGWPICVSTCLASARA